MENCMPKMKLTEKVNIKKIETKILNGRKINIKIVLELDLKLYSNNNISLITSINNLKDIQMLNNSKQINSLMADGKTTVYAKDNITVDSEDDLAEIMQVKVCITDKNIKLSYNKVLAKADLQVYIMYLTEDNLIKNLSYKIPIMGFIDIENIGENNTCDINYSIKNLIIKPNSSESNSIYAEAEIEVECFAYEEKEINLIEDLYSISENLVYKQKEINIISDKKSIKETCKINDSIQIPEMSGNKLYNVQTEPFVTNCSIRNGKAIFEGNVNIELLYEISGGIESRDFEIPFNFEIISDYIDSNSNINYEIEIKRDDYIVNSSNVDINLDLEFNLDVYKSEKLDIIEEISTEEKEENSIYSMVIYFVKPGDTLWKIAKKFKSTVEEISKTNEIEDVNKIHVGQQLYIPRFVNKMIAV